MVSLNISEKPLFTRPELLLHHQIPLRLVGINSRTIEGKEWWDVVRKEAYAKNNYCCWACGTPRLDAPKCLLDAHECYEYEYDERRAHFVGVVALCRDCHQFIHYRGIEDLRRLKHVLERGLRILRDAGLTLPHSQVKAAKYWGLEGPYDNVAARIPYGTSERHWKLLYEGFEYPLGEVHVVAAKVHDYYRKRRLKWPTVEQSLLWLQSELGEASELFLGKEGGWVRNNPEDKSAYTPQLFGEELGDVIFMAIVAGLLSGLDPLTAMLDKMERKIRDAREERDRSSKA